MSVYCMRWFFGSFCRLLNFAINAKWIIAIQIVRNGYKFIYININWSIEKCIRINWMRFVLQYSARSLLFCSHWIRCTVNTKTTNENGAISYESKCALHKCIRYHKSNEHETWMATTATGVFLICSLGFFFVCCDTKFCAHLYKCRFVTIYFAIIFCSVAFCLHTLISL